MTDQDRNVAKATFFSMIRNDPHNDDNRLIFADWCEENNEPELAGMLRGESKRWMQELAIGIGHRGWDEDRVFTYQELIAAGEQYLDTGHYTYLTYDTPDIVYENRKEFWKHFEVLTGRRPPEENAEDTFFACSC